MYAAQLAIYIYVYPFESSQVFVKKPLGLTLALELGRLSKCPEIFQGKKLYRPLTIHLYENVNFI